MIAIHLNVNGKRSDLLVAPRTHLADVLREQLSLTGTHLGCEQGVCGACTVLIDGKPMRSCIAFAVACDGAQIQTIEGFANDPLMTELREAFSAHHALQCGFCTPGMLITSRDVVQRLGETSESKVRQELSGNLCRCTGYVGIVQAVQAVAVGKSPAPQALGSAADAPVAMLARPAERAVEREPAKTTTMPRSAPIVAANGAGWTELKQIVRVAASPSDVWKAVKDVNAMARCLPGASIETFDGTRFQGVLAVKFGPIRANFGGEGTVAYEDGTSSGLVEGGGSDARTGSQVRGQVEFIVKPDDGGGSDIDVTIRFRITGTLAQFARGALVQNFVGHLTGIFADNLARMAAGDTVNPQASASGELNLFGLAGSVVKTWIANTWIAQRLRRWRN